MSRKEGMPVTLPELFDTRDLARRYHVKAITVKLWVQSGGFPAPDRLIRNRPFWTAATLADWEAEEDKRGRAVRKQRQEWAAQMREAQAKGDEHNE